ncbi:MAG: hypothetical protein HY861_01660 [Chlamydiia bacterium]|nr:hypothetical protein [Chlamydiia bacterium]
MKHRGWVVFSGILWLVIGTMLTYKGLSFIAEAVLRMDSLCARWQGVFGSAQQAGMVLTAAALMIGFIKGRFILSKTVHRITTRIYSLPLPIQIFSVYPKSYWLIIGSMVGMGMLFRFLPISLDLRGFIDVAVGSALLNGSGLYFRESRRESLS